ncbi:MAG: bifunctional 2',3'-cyclic-nucleotide 2'-phosphodiesterase/3'-nucleotidase [Thermotaleaceae bacterium]
MQSKREKGFMRKIAAVVVLCMLLVLIPVLPANAEVERKDVVKLRIIGTTDIHTHFMNYDYYKDAPSDEFGFVKVATLIKASREEVENSLLFDNGDLIQGNPFGDYMAKVKGLKDGEIYPVIEAMNQLGYDGATVGNHEFNFGLEFLNKAIYGADFPYVTANVYIDDKDQDSNNDKNYFTPYVILDKTFKDEEGQEQAIKVGVIGFVPPQIMTWDRNHLEGKVITKDIVETAEKYIPEMKKAGADIIVALAHTGIEPSPRKGNDENAAFYLSEVEGIDAILSGHSHKTFPGSGYDNIEGIDNVKGTLNGIAAVIPGSWGSHLGVMDLTLEKIDGKWQAVDGGSKAIPIYDKTDKKSLAAVDESMAAIFKANHEEAVNYVRGEVGKTTAPIYSYFAVVQDDPSIQIVTNAQKWYVENQMKGTEYENIPVLSAGAPFKAGGRGGAEYYTNIPAGTMAIKNMADLYVYANTVTAVLLNGEEVKEWLEMSAGQFNQIDPNKPEEQLLVNDDFPTYNFDVIDGVTYEIDVTEPAKYDTKGGLVNPQANRIKNLKYNGGPVTKEQKFIVVTNNYRSGGGGNFPGVNPSKLILESPDENRQVIVNYIDEIKTINPTADNNWNIAAISGDVQVVFESSPAAKVYADRMDHIQFVAAQENGFAKYKLDLKPQTAVAPAEKTEAVEEKEAAVAEKAEMPQAAAQPQVQVTTAFNAPVPTSTYTVKSGDVLWKIAKGFGLTYEEVASFNNLSNPHKIYPGQKLLIPHK